MSEIPLCPCGCGRSLVIVRGVRQIVCDAFLTGLPQSLVLRAEAGPMEVRRAAVKDILKAAHQWRIAQGGRYL